MRAEEGVVEVAAMLMATLLLATHYFYVGGYLGGTCMLELGNKFSSLRTAPD